MTAFAYYLLKMTICSGVLFVYYHLSLRNKLFHQWNRFYLLAAVLISLLAPVLQVSILHSGSEESNKAIQVLQVIQSADGYLEEITIGGHRHISADQWLMMAYAIVSAILLISLLLALKKVFSIIRSHSVQWIEKIKFINTKVQGTPFSFFHFIFWNDKINLQTETGQQIFRHELVHVKEKHTLDKLFIQLILVFFWCNPFFWLIRRELKLIHEFIADQKAVGEHGTAALAAMILNTSYPSQFNAITNQFFQTSIKRRLAMLTKIQNPRINYLSRILALPILGITILAFTLRTRNVTTIPSVQLEKQVVVVIDAGHGLTNDGKHSGASEGNVYEDEITLAIANKIKELNTNEALKIVLTRPTEQIVDLHERVDIARENNADLFISLHVNVAVPNQNPDLRSPQSGNKGFEICVSNKDNRHQQQSELLGSALAQELKSVYFVNPSLLKRKVGIWVLDQNVCPAVLLECGFLTDKTDKAFITKSGNQTVIARKILAAIEKYAWNQQEIRKDKPDTVPSKNLDLSITKDNKQSPESTPLFILDDKEVSKEEALKTEPSTIESINVLKDEAATDKYGSKGENGVVEIKTKKQKSDKDISFQENGKTMATGTIKYNSETNEFRGKFNTVGDSQKDTVPKKEPVFKKVEIEASVNKEEWSHFLRKNLQPFIEEAAAKGIAPGTYTVKVRFIVKKDGSISDFEALNDPGYGLAENVLGIMKDSPKWYPAQQNNKPVNSYHTQPITFVVQEQ